jgi:hypothetical protein
MPRALEDATGIDDLGTDHWVRAHRRIQSSQSARLHTGSLSTQLVQKLDEQSRDFPGRVVLHPVTRFGKDME